MKHWHYLILVAALISFGGCSTKGGEKPAEENMQTSVPILDNAQTNGANDQDFIGSENLDDQNDMSNLAGAPTQNIIYFDFDQSSLRADQQNLLEQHARYLIDHPNVRVRLEGHADERGSVEYNFALGERRAESAKRMLNILGVASDNLTTLSYGEEMPISRGHDEMSWQENRRVEIVYY